MSSDPFSEESYLSAATQAVRKIRELAKLLTEHGGTCVHAAKKLAIHVYRIEIVKADPGMVIRKGWGPRDKPYACRLSDRALLTRRYDPWDESLSDVEQRLSGLCEWAMTVLEPLTKGGVESDTVASLNRIADNIDGVLGVKKLADRYRSTAPTPEQSGDENGAGQGTVQVGATSELSPPGIGRASAKDVREWLDRYMKNHDFSGINALADTYKGQNPGKSCSPNTIKKAIEGCEKLRRWRAQAELNRTKPKGPAEKSTSDPQREAFVNEAHERLLLYATEQEQKKWNNPDFVDHLHGMADEAIQELIEDIKKQYEIRQRAASARTVAHS